MKMSPNEFITVATQFLAGDGEGRWRSAVSRAYYGAFHVGRELLSACGVVIRIDTVAHRNVRWCFANSGERSLENAAKLLDTLREARNDADYELSSTQFNARANAKAEVERAIEIVTLLAQYDAAEVKSGVAPRIRAYATTIGLLLQPMP
jgi:uncharacterized protein (UPF0332 family)